MVDSVCGRQPTDNETVLKQVHTLFEGAFVVAHVHYHRPVRSDSTQLVQKHQVHLALISLQVVGVVSIQKQSADPPVVGKSFFLLPLGQNEVKSVVEGLVGLDDDGSPVRNDSKSERQCSLDRSEGTVGISTSKVSLPSALRPLTVLDPKSWYSKATISDSFEMTALHVCT